jgi:predicted dehydrogenase
MPPPVSLSRRAVLAASAFAAHAAQSDRPLRVVLAGLVHGHAGGLLRRIQGRTDIEIAGVAEAKREVCERYAKQFSLPLEIFGDRLEAVLDARRPDAVMAFTDTFDHKMVVETCAPRRIPVMVEKPLAVSFEHARAIEALSKKHGVPVMVNYETTWYPSVHQVKSMAPSLGGITKIVVRDGHQGPKEIGVQPEFLAWLTDPARNGAGALFDFGCYGANLASWLFENRPPLTVTAVTQQLKPEIYSKVDDESVIVLTYPGAQVLIQGSWNWPHSRKDMDVYGREGHLLAPNRDTVLARIGKQAEAAATVAPLGPADRDDVSYLISVVKGGRKPDGLSSLENNMIVMRILSAAVESALSGQTVKL